MSLNDAAKLRPANPVDQVDRGHGGSLHQLPPRDSTTLVRAVGERLRAAIAREELPAGTRLNQVQLASQLGVSRMPIRAAIAMLTAEGLIETLPTGGAVVRALTRQDLLDVYEVRTGLEVQAVRRLAAEQSTEQLGGIVGVLDKHRPFVYEYDTRQLLDVDREFHSAILDATENPYFRKAMVPVWSIVERAMFGMLSLSHVAAVAWDEHEAIAASIRGGEPELAAELMRRHLEEGAAELTRLLDPGGDHS